MPPWTWISAAATTAATAWFLANYNLWRIPRPRAWPRLLMYHRCDDIPGDGMNTRPEVFEQQLAWLAPRCRFLTVSQLLQQTTELGERPPVCLTFDDGFRDNYERAFPLLQRFRASATIYLAPQISGIDSLRATEIRGMVDSGLIEFGAHTVHHVNLTQVDEATARREIVDSKNAVEQLTGRPCHSFAYPFGRWNDRVAELVREAGFLSAVTTRKTIKPLSKIDPFRIPRLSMNGRMTPWQFRIAFSRGRYRV